MIRALAWLTILVAGAGVVWGAWQPNQGLILAAGVAMGCGLVALLKDDAQGIREDR